MNTHEYYARLLHAIAQNPFVAQTQLELIQVTGTECRIRGSLLLTGDRRLHVSEYTVTDPAPQRLKYRYHLQDADGRLICRWDNAPHHAHIPSFPHHCHTAEGHVSSSTVRSLEDVLGQMVPYLTA